MLSGQCHSLQCCFADVIRWELGSYGYHGDDGQKFYQQNHGQPYGPRFTTGDVIGACLHLQKRELSFTCANCFPPTGC